MTMSVLVIAHNWGCNPSSGQIDELFFCAHFVANHQEKASGLLAVYLQSTESTLHIVSETQRSLPLGPAEPRYEKFSVLCCTSFQNQFWD